MQRAKADAKKEEQERLTKILLDMLKEEENKYCADCQAKTPRWAAWNLGIFICIRCAGIHRNLGVHISKVRSVNLDSWTPEQVQSMRVMGNEKARKVYEAKLPEGFRRSMADHQLEQFIRGKYEQKRYILPDFVYPRIDVSELPKTGQPATKKTPTAIFSKTPLSSVTPSSPGHISSVKSAPQIADLLDFSAPSAPAAAHSGGGGADSLIGDLASIDIQTQPSSQSADLDDMFGSFVSAPAAPPSASSAAPPSGGDFFSSMPSTVSPTTPTAAATSPNGNGISSDLMGLSVGGGADDEKRTNADILALFGGAGQQQTQQISAPGGFSAFGIQAAPAQPQQQQQQQNQFAAFGAPAPQQQQHQQFGGLHQQFQMPIGQPQMQTQFGGFGGQPMAATNPANFPNPFGPPGVGAPLGAGFAMTAPAAPATQSMQGFSTGGGGGRANNAFADLSIGKVMSSYKNPKAATAMTSSTPNNNATTVSQPADMNFDDLLGL